MNPFILADWFTLLQSILLSAGFFVAALTFYNDTKARKVQNLLTIVRNHREIWSQYAASKDLRRIRLSSVNLVRRPVTDQERFFILSTVLHLFTAHQAERMGQIKPFAGMEDDVQRFFSRPIASAVWKEIRTFQNPDFVRYIDQLIDEQDN